MRVSSVRDEYIICLNADEVDILVDLCHAGAFSSHIDTTPERRRRLGHFLWEVSQTLLPAVQKRYGRKILNRNL